MKRAALLFLALLMGPTLAGCLGGGEEKPRLAQPTDGPIRIPTATTPRAPTTAFNFSDPGYRMTGTWRVGDGWDYESNQSNVRRVRVIDTRLVNGTTFYVVEERFGEKGRPMERTVTSWVDGRRWLLVNSTASDGEQDRYQPGIPLRYFRNGSFNYSQVHTTPGGGGDLVESVTVQARLQGPHQTLLFPWGYVESRRVEAWEYATRGGNTTARNVVRWVHADYLNDVQYQLPGGETFKLVAAKAGDFRRGTLAS